MWHLTPASEGGAGDGGPGGRHDHSAVMYDGRMYIFGGMNGLQTKDELWSWNFSSRKWTKIRCHRGGPPPMKGHCTCRLDDTMLVFGGSCGNVLHSDLWSFHFSECLSLKALITLFSSQAARRGPEWCALEPLPPPEATCPASSPFPPSATQIPPTPALTLCPS